MKLTDAQIKHAKPKAKQYKLSDGRGMYLLVKPTGSKLWRFDYRFKGNRKTISLGTYPEISLKGARERLGEARKLLSNDVDPGYYRKIQKIVTDTNTFEVVAREWFAKNSLNWVESHSSKIIRRLERDVFPWLGERDVSADLRGALPPAKAKHHPSIIDPVQIGVLLRAIDGYQGGHITKCALQMAAHVFVRPGELRHAEWSEFNFKTCEWRIPAEKMKMRTPHIVPLSTQVLTILDELRPLTGSGKYLFPSVRSSKRPMSNNTVNAALRRLSYTKEEMTGHGFRSMASTQLNELGWNRDAIERQLAHSERDSVRAAYNFAEHLDERRKMMQAWSDYLDRLKKGGDIVDFKNRSMIG